ncbi:DNA-binding MarR family transcriptional regulator [Tamaricihabitans halophyticus]|uniref:DNA-binding MarR family transcriptional regulator n=1 Tax=Tamaricihabitans halophyticus TaxID=1262583 RepID=A0A4R2QXP4_9PSEU|nr:MarR family transcriptional regulator [Tamaricihabitans halophyticus]TCP51925.1 DNA-binding MarR family transcriptional regulator [Tamaricihabitans halophyticus]
MTLAPDDRVGFHVKRVEQELIALKTLVLKPSGLTVPQYSALVMISLNPGATAAALARFNMVTPQTMATILTNLADKGLVERKPDPYHLNSISVELTDYGKQILATADQAAVSVERTLGAAFTDEERETLISLLARCSDTLHAQAAEHDGGNAAMRPYRGSN